MNEIHTGVRKPNASFNSDTQARTFVNRTDKIIMIIGVLWSLFYLYTVIWPVAQLQQRFIHLPIGLALCFLYFPMTRKSEAVEHRLLLRDIILAVVAFFAMYLFMQINRPSLDGISTLQIASGIAAVLLVLEGSRRAFSWVLPGLAVLFLFYAFTGQYLVSFLLHSGYSLKEVLESLSSGTFSFPGNTTFANVFGLTLFYVFLREAGTGGYLFTLFLAILGPFRGGPAKAIVIAAAFLRSITGVPTANANVTGSHTISVLQKNGYKPEVIGAVESAVLTNSQLMPPLMGAAGFVIAEFMGMSYVQVITAATLPALLSLGYILAVLHLESKKSEIKPSATEEIPPFWPTLFSGIQYFIPILIFIYFILTLQAAPAVAVIPSIGAVVILAIIIKVVHAFKNLRSGQSTKSVHKQAASIWTFIIRSLDGGARAMAAMTVGFAAASFILSVITLTGLQGRMVVYIETLAGNSLVWVLLLTAGVCLIAGMGMPAPAKRIVTAVLTAAAIPLVQPNLHWLAVHLFIFYYAVLADSVPRIGIAAHSAYQAAGSDPNKTGLLGVKYNLAAF
ncbi:TRAP transporter permease, partial [Dethiobacter alkaliphilus]|uniref:TRAP transporter permease n=1 Tax=Dethiobacter alkaliphilus TaxID=427926 RepID=UPI00222659A1